MFKDLLNIIASSAVIAALIRMSMQNQSNQITNITGSRAAWRQDIKKYTKKIYPSEGKELIEVLNAIKVNLNGYGCHRKGKYPEDEKLDFFKDEHIWKEIDQLETECAKGAEADNALLEKGKSRLTQYIILLLKFDWERSKSEIKKNKMAVCSVLFFCVTFFAFCIQNLDITREIGLIQLQAAFLYFIPWMLTYFLFWFPSLLENLKILKSSKWYKTLQYHIYCWPIGIMAVVFIIPLYSRIYNISIDLAMIFFFISLYIVMLHPMSKRLMYMDYDRNIIEFLQLDSLMIYPMKAEYNFIRVSIYFLEKDMNYKRNDNNNEFLEDDEFKAYISGIKKSRTVLRWFWCLDYFLRKKKAGLYNYIKAYPNRCKCVVKYKTEKEVKYSVGYQKKLWDKWLQ